MEGEGLDPPSHKSAFMRENVLWLPFLLRTAPRGAHSPSEPATEGVQQAPAPGLMTDPASSSNQLLHRDQVEPHGTVMSGGRNG